MKVYVLLQHFGHSSTIEGIFTTAEAAVNHLNHEVETDTSIISLTTRVKYNTTTYELHHRAVAGISTNHITEYSIEEHEVQE